MGLKREDWGGMGQSRLGSDGDISRESQLFFLVFFKSFKKQSQDTPGILFLSSLICLYLVTDT